MDTEYDFTQTINTTQLMDEISTSGLPAPDYINTSGTSIQIFYASPLTSSQQTTLSTVVANHVANINYISLAIQAQVNTLIGYLTNANVTVANTARAAVVQAIAPNLPISTLISINNKIATTLG